MSLSSSPARHNSLDRNASRITSPSLAVEASLASRLSDVLRHFDVRMAISLVVLVVAVYWPTVKFDFVNWDDPWYVINNPLIRSWHPSNLMQVATQVVTRNFAPATIASFLVDHTVWGLWPGGYHLTNVFLHAINSVLVYVLVVQLSRNRSIGWATAALFALHPVQIETVAWISSRKGLLSASFILSSLICWLRPERTGKQEGLGLLFLGLALLSKAIAVVVPPVVLLYDMLICRRSFAESLARQFIPGLMALWLLLATMSAQTTIVGGVRGHFALNKLQILAVDSVIVWRYMGMLAWPDQLCVLYDPPVSGIALKMTAAIVGWLVVSLVVWRCRRRYPMAAFACAMFALFLIPVLNLFPITTLMNDRYLYLPSVPVFALAAAGLARVLKVTDSQAVCELTHDWADKARTCLMWGTVTAGVFGCAVMTARHLPVWRNGRSLWTHTVQHVPQLPVVQIQLANTLHQEGQTLKAINVLQQTLVNHDPDPADRKRILKKIADWQ